MGELEDASHAPVEVSLTLLESLHDRWVRCCVHYSRKIRAPLQSPGYGEFALDVNLALYSWHGQHHMTHITTCANAKAGTKPHRHGLSGERSACEARPHRITIHAG